MKGGSPGKGDAKEHWWLSVSAKDSELRGPVKVLSESTLQGSDSD